MSDPSAQPTAARVWRLLVADSAQSSADAFDLLSRADPASLRSTTYTALPGPQTREMWEAGRVRIGDYTFDLGVDVSLRRVDTAITAYINSHNGETAASTLNSLDCLLAGIMQSAARQDVRNLYRLAAVWRQQVLMRMEDLGAAADKFDIGKRRKAVAGAQASETLSVDVP